MFAMFINKNIWVDWRRTRGFFLFLSETYDYIKSWFVWLIECFTAPAAVAAEPSAILVSCLACVEWVQREGCTGIFSYCWTCTQSTVLEGPAALYENCMSYTTGGVTGIFEFCTSCSAALSRGPTGVFEYLQESLQSCLGACMSSTTSEDSLLVRCYAGTSSSLTWLGESGWYVLEWTGSRTMSCGREYGPVLYGYTIALRDFLWSWLMWFWRQVRLFFT